MYTYIYIYIQIITIFQLKYNNIKSKNLNSIIRGQLFFLGFLPSSGH
jgi:hypothetical protein